jgi:hypothetical protein
MPTRPSQTAQDILNDARDVLKAARANLAGFQAADKGKKVKSLDAALLTRLEKNITAGRAASGNVSAGKAAVRAATSSEVAARQKLYGLIIGIRDDIKLAYPADKSIGKAFGVGTKVRDHITKDLLDTADSIAASFGSEFTKQAKDAGVTAARIAQLGKARDALDAADGAQATKIGARKGSAATKTSTLDAIKTDVARIRAVAKIVFKGKPTQLAAFTSRLSRHAVKKRAPKNASATPAPAK